MLCASFANRKLDISAKERPNMLRLQLSNGSEWLDLGHGVRLRVTPLTTPVMMAARRAAQGQIMLPDGDTPATADLDTDSIGLAMAKAVARIVVTDWEGVGDAEGNPVPVSDDGIDALLDIWPIFEAFQTLYVGRAMILDAEKNASPPLPNGNSVGAAPIAQPAKRNAKTARRA
jgi:hypothetical protein